MRFLHRRCSVLIPSSSIGPLAIRLIKPKPMEVNIDGPRHPTTWQQVSKSVSSSTGKANAAILECDIDLLTERTIRKIINIVRPHIQSITCDLALIISTPKGSKIEEVSTFYILQTSYKRDVMRFYICSFLCSSYFVI